MTKANYTSLAVNAGTALLGALSPGFLKPVASDAANVVITLVQQDWLTGSTIWRNQTTQALQVYNTQSPRYTGGTSTPYEAFNGDTLYWALAAANAYRAYNDSSFLAMAQTLWNVAFTDYISSENVQSGNFSRPFNITSACQQNLAGGIFNWHQSTTQLDMSGDVLGTFVDVTAHLYSLTRNNTYLSAAELTVQFI